MGDSATADTPVAHMPTGGRQQRNRVRFGTLEHGGQVADNAARLFSQRQLDGEVQILDDIAEPSGSLEHHDITRDLCSDRRNRTCVTVGTGVGWLRHGALDSVVRIK